MRVIPPLAIFAAALLTGCVTPAPVPEPRQVAADATREVVRAYLAAAEAKDAAAAARLFADDARYEDVTFSYAIEGRPAIQAMLGGALAMLDPVERRIKSKIVEGDQAAVEWEAEGIQVAPALGVPATSRPIVIRAVSLIRVRDGRIQSVTDYTDRAGLEAQLKAAGKG